MRTSDYTNDENLSQKTAGWLKAIRADSAARDHLVLNIGQCALIVVDMLRYFASHDGRCFLPASTPCASRIEKLVATWRSSGQPIVFTRHCHQGEHDLGMLGRFFSDYIKEGEADSEIIENLTPLPGELVVKKTTYDAFLGTLLETHLRKEGITQVLITGVLTHMCCETTARSAFCRGFEVYVPVDATASTTEERHLNSLKGMADSVAVITSTDEVLKSI